MSAEAPWLDAPVVDDPEPWKSAPIVEDAEQPWLSAPVVEDAPSAPAERFGSSTAPWPTTDTTVSSPTLPADDIAITQRAAAEGKPVVIVDGKPTIGEAPQNAPMSSGDQIVQGIERGLGGAALRVTEGVTRLVGASGVADALGKDVAAMDSVLPAQTTAGKVGSGVGGALALLSGGGLSGALGIAGTQAVAGGYDAAYEESLKKGNPEEIARIDAQQGAFKSVLRTVPELAAYWLLGLGAAKIAEPLVRGAGPLVKAAVTGAAATGANVATSTVLHGLHGEPLFTAEGLAMDATFGFGAHGLAVAKQAVSSEAQVREMLKSTPLESLKAAAEDPAFRKSSPYRPELIDAELASRTTNAGATPEGSPPIPEPTPSAAAPALLGGDSPSSSPGGVPTPANKGVLNSASGHAKALADVIENPAFIEHGLSGLDIPSQRVVKSSVFRAANDPEILQSIIKLIPVDVVNSLKARQLTPEMALHDEMVFSDILSGEPKNPISVPADVASSIVRNTALGVAKNGGILSDYGGPFINGLSAVGADSLHTADVTAKQSGSPQLFPLTETAATNSSRPAGQGEAPPLQSEVRPTSSGEPAKVAAEGKGAANDWTEATIPDLVEKPASVAPEKAGVTLGAVPPGFAELTKLGTLVKEGAKKVAAAITDIPAFHDFRKSVLNWSARNQKATGEVFKAAKEIAKSVPDKTRREAITNWIQAGGDAAVLADRASKSVDLKRKQGYEAALTLTPEETALAGKIRQTYDILLKRAEANGIEISEIQNYVNQIWKRQPLKEFVASSNRKLSTSIRFAKQRYYDSFFHGEQAGLKPETKDIAKLLPIYMNEVNNAIAAKQLVAELAQGKGTDGRPLVAPGGGAKTIEGADGGKAHLVFPDMRNVETRDYVKIEQPALHDWRWKGQDTEGNPIMVKSDLLVHPEVASKFKNMLGDSAIREWYRSPSENILGDIPKAAVKFLLDDAQQIAKATMLGFLSPFHQVQEGTHAVGHKVNPFGGIPKIDLTKPEQMDAAQHGLMLLPDRVSSKQFREGLDGSNRNLLANVIGLAGKPGAIIKAWADGYQNYLFHEYIPGLKLKTYEHILDRNSKRYVDELASGDVTMDQIKYLSAQQSNAAYGHLNYADIGRNPTIQHLAQVLLLAPDFLEARGRFAGQAVKGTVAKAGREQLVAIATLAVTQYVLARVLNKTADDDYHWNKPFSVIVGGREYTMRSVPEDIYKATTNTRRFITGRLSPLVGRGLLEGLSGVNYRSEPTTAAETFTNIIAGAVPLTLQPATRGLTETGKDNPVSPFEQLLGSLGLHVSRFSPVSEVYHLSKEWTEKHAKEYGLDKRRAVFPVSKYQQLRYALEDGNKEKAKSEMADLMKEEKISQGDLEQRFKQSIHHPFTGSVATDTIFKASLDERGKKIYDAAIKRRELLVERFKAFK